MKHFLACLLGATMAAAFAIFAYAFIALIFASLVLGVELSIKLWMFYLAGGVEFGYRFVLYSVRKRNA